MTQAKSVDNNEVEKFSAMADEWWDESGKFKPLHKFNPTRIKFMQEIICHHFNQSDLKGLDIVDIGCGGGLISEPISRLGAKLTSIDASEKNIQVASIHAEKSGLDINYQATSAEDLAESGVKFDVVINMEVIEHVADVASFMKASCELLKPNGVMFVATLNRTLKSYTLAILGAEYILKWLPKGTHNWKKFLKPAEIEQYLSDNAVNLQKIQGVSYNPLTDKWSLSSDINVNYMMVANKISS